MLKQKTTHPVRAARHCITLLFCVTFTAAFAIAQADTDVAALNAGQQIDREMAGGQTHIYTVHLSSGQFLHLSVDQNGIDVALKLLGPDAQSVVTLDGPNGRFGPEDIAIVAENPGEYRLEVRSPNKVAAAGQYKISIINLRTPTEADREKVAAESLYVEAIMKLQPQRTAAARLAAIERLQQALVFFRATGEVYRQAWIMHTIVLLNAQMGDFRKAFDLAGQTLPLFRSVKDVLGEASTINFLGGMSDVLGDPQGALGYYDQALAMTRASQNRITEASVLNNIGKIHNDLAEWQTAVDFYNQALPILRSTGNQRVEGITLHNMGVAYVGLGDWERAMDMLQQALAIRRTVGDRAGEADTLTSIGYIHNTSGRSDEALKFYNQALPLRSAVGDRRNEGTTLDHIGIAYASMGEPARALEFHHQALERHRAAESPRTEAIALGNIGHVYNLLAEPQKAVEFYMQALTIFRNIGDRQNEAKILEGLARAERRLGNLNPARQHIENALTLIEAVRSSAGAQQARSSYLASRHGAYELYIDLLMQLHRGKPSAGYDALAIQASERVRARSLTELLGEARVDIRQGVDAALIARERETARKLNAKAQRQIQLRSQKGDNRKEIETLDREVSELEIQYQQVQTAIREASPAYAGLTQPRTLSLSEIQEQLGPNTLLLEYSLGDERSYLWAASKSELKSYELPGRLQVQQSARSVYELLTARSTEKKDETPAQRMQRIAAADIALRDAAAELSRIVLAPVAAELGNRRLLIVADDALQYVPFAILPVANRPAPADHKSSGEMDRRAVDAYRPLVADHEIISLPSVSALAVQRRSLAGRLPGMNAIAVLADPVFSANDTRIRAADGTTPRQSLDAEGTRKLEHSTGELSAKMSIRRLKFTREEADQILAMSPQTSNIKALDFNANRATATSAELGRYRYVHFATHGYLDSSRPDLSALVLSLIDRNGNPEDGFLRAHDIYNLNLPAELVVLSACQTGLGKDIKGEGLVGLTRGFMYAGARRVVVSLWSVNDKATAELMRRFYRGMLRENLAPAAALRQAQVELSRQTKWQSPYYWAAFVLHGD